MSKKKNFLKGEKDLFSGKVLSNIITGAVIGGIFVVFLNFAKVLEVAHLVYVLFRPFLAGMGIAYFLNLLLVPVEKKIFFKIKNKVVKRYLSLSLSLLIAAIIIMGLIFLIVPQFVESLTQLVANAPQYLNEAYVDITALLVRYGISETLVLEFLDPEDTINYIVGYVRDLIPSMVNFSIAFGSGIASSLIALVTAIYILADKERLIRNFSLVLKAFTSEKAYSKTAEIISRAQIAFTSFLSGKTLDSLIIGLICLVFMLIFDMPYVPMITIIIAVTNMIPTIGPFIGGLPSSIIILLVDPIQGLWFGLFVILLQQFDGNILGPKILGESIGISAIWILFSVVFFGSLWGVLGMLIGVPLFAVCYDLFKEFIFNRLRQKHLENKKQDADNEEFVDD